MQIAQVAPDTMTFTAAIKACRRGGNLSAALALLERLRSGEGQSGVDEVAYVETAAVCATARDDARAVGLLAKMREDGVTPGPMMYGAVIDACARMGSWLRALDLLEVPVLAARGDGGWESVWVAGQLRKSKQSRHR